MEQIRVDNHDILANKGIEIYSNWLKRKEQQDDNYRHQLFAAVDKYSTFDLLQMKINVEDSTIEEQQYIELKDKLPIKKWEHYDGFDYPNEDEDDSIKYF